MTVFRFEFFKFFYLKRLKIYLTLFNL
uniref:Uncharacterized protein n=1 Tax=Anguilla anguilla TaxID=7936 RepID=A0A0E9Q7A5_ANGAN